MTHKHEKVLFKKNYLFILGPTKTGTTSFHSVLAQHPRIISGYKKELNYFRKKSGELSEEEYLKNFNGIEKEGDVYLDSSPWYFSDDFFYKNLNNVAFLNAKGLVFIRNPYDRLRSMYYFYLQKNRIKQDGNEGLKNFIECEIDRSNTMYYSRIEELKNKFGEKNILCFNFDDVVKNQLALSKCIFKELGLSCFDTKYKYKNKTVYKNKDRFYFYFKSKFYHPCNIHIEKNVRSRRVSKGLKSSLRILNSGVWRFNEMLKFFTRKKREEEGNKFKREDFLRLSGGHYDKEIFLLEKLVTRI